MNRECEPSTSSNCSNEGIKCHECGVLIEGGVLHYKPILLEQGKYYKDHPLYKERKEKEREDMARRKIESKKKGKASRKGIKSEEKRYRELESDIGKGIEKTKGSGRYYQDGDMIIKLPNGNKISIEHKERVANRNVRGPTKEEWEKGGAETIYIISSKEEKVVVMGYEVFREIIREIYRKGSEDIE